ncbi:glutamine--tRNA ligase/YqeY domain fusion protein [Catalinimonas niigatensis]|uniref:glutamine--tRNA ligase/YqeY domain fusion protein n=1 Tax=Catalinimonas niigatensis TaxID=1397264 RepID=UPI002666654C|nr:glutamine--tRNA ligase/YqeY domain fusion protein [Catalinimonas niigatensis]WPP52404.1 glutamine--tRNA ligase/YqeY domain fusion protein [Catalinimonas niigatensis]
MNKQEERTSLNFLEAIVEEDISKGKNGGVVHTRFPPEPNGYLHIGHAKSICLNFGLAQKYGGKTNLRFDDTNPVNESLEYINSIKHDVRWLGFDWEEREYYASDYFDQFYEWAIKLIKEGKAYVDDSSVEEIRRMRGIPTEPGEESPYRNRSVEENLDLFARMKAGEFPEGSRVLRAKIDMTSPNMQLRDPVMYRILHKEHHRTGDTWKIYPNYDWAHGQSDALEGITHSICTLEFEIHRPLYEWFLDQIGEFKPRPRQIEFARLNLSYTVMSKRKLLELVNGGYVSGWDDPRMPTIQGIRRRGYTPESLRNFAERVGVAKRDNVIDLSLLEFCIREDLNKLAPRVMGVLDPVKLIITNYPEGKTEDMEIENNPEDPESGNRIVPFSRELYIERDDFMEDAPKKFFRLGPGKEVRLKGAYIIQCDSFKKNPQTGEIEEIYCTYDHETKSGEDTSGKKVKGTIHWVSAPHALAVEVRVYDRLFSDPDPAGHKEKDFKEFLNPDSLQLIEKAYVEPSLKNAKPLEPFQFMRKGYYTLDPDSSSDQLIFNQTVTLRDTWAKIQNQ